MGDQPKLWVGLVGRLVGGVRCGVGGGGVQQLRRCPDPKKLQRVCTLDGNAPILVYNPHETNVHISNKQGYILHLPTKYLPRGYLHTGCLLHWADQL